jgi:hypothetical protein
VTAPAYPLDAREHATVLAALRFYQRKAVAAGTAADMPEHDIATSAGTLTPLDDIEIDVLCEQLNSG